jgi:hypothetical protein
MSYSKNYSTSVSYSGSISYSYPASQNGGSGTAHYSGSVPVNVTIDVNTDPFDGSVNCFKTSIVALGASVAAMHAAQCAAIQQTASKISESLIKGFFGTINSELSQQLQALDNAIKAGFGLIQQLDKSISDKKDVMEGDFNRISSRYMKIFADLDNECYKRIYALDKQSFTLSEKVLKQLLFESTSDTAAMNLLSVEELSSSKTLVFVSSLNRKVLEVLKTLHNYISQEFSINKLINTFLFNEETKNPLFISIPVIWSESDITEGGEINYECFVSDQIDQEKRQIITEKVNMFCSGSSSKWKIPKETEKETLNREFNTLAESHFLDAGEQTERIYRTMLSLWQNTQTSSLEENL